MDYHIAVCDDCAAALHEEWLAAAVACVGVNGGGLGSANTSNNNLVFSKSVRNMVCIGCMPAGNDQEGKTTQAKKNERSHKK